MAEKDDQPKLPTIIEKLFESLMAFYTPAETAAEATETKSTQELIEEMDQIADGIFPFQVNVFMETNGFKLHYTGLGYVWLLKTR